MVLISRRAACVAGIVAALGAPLSAQQPQTAQAPQSAQLRRGEEHPLLFGFALECSLNCAPGERARGRSGGGVPATLAHFPLVIAVAPGSAAERAGIHPGDRLMSIDGHSVIIEAGASRLANAKAGETVKLEFERDGKPMSVSLLLGATPNPPNAREQRIFGGYIAMHGAHLRGSVDLEIWSNEPIVPTDSTTDSTGTVILRIGTGTLIKLRLVPDSADTSRTGRGGGSDVQPSRPIWR